MRRFIEIVYDDSGSMKSFIDLDGRKIEKYNYAHDVFKETILPVLNIKADDVITIRKLRRGGCNGESQAERLPNDNLEILRFLKGINHDNGTPLYRTIKDSFDSFKKYKSDGIIIIITDGLDSCKDNIADILPQELVDQINLGITVVLVPFAIADGEMLDKLNTIGRTIKARTTPIGDKKNQNSEKNKEDFKRAIDTKEKIKAEKEVDIQDLNDNDSEKLTYPLNQCYEYKNEGEIDWETLELINFSYHNALRLYHEDLISWEPKKNKTINSTQFEELNFLFGLVFKTGLPLSIVKTMLAQLKKPYYYNSKCIYWDFSEACWKYFKNVEPVTSNGAGKSEVNNHLVIEKFYEVIKNEDDTIVLKQRARGKNIRQLRKYVNIGDFIEFKQKGRKKI